MPIVSADFVYYICVSESHLVRIELRIAQSTAQGLTIGPWKLLNLGRSCGFLYNEHGQICANIWSDLSSMPIRSAEIFKCATFAESDRRLYTTPHLHLVESSTSTQSQLNSTLDIFTIYGCVRLKAHYLPALFWLADFLVVANFLLVEFSEAINCSAQCAKEIVF